MRLLILTPEFEVAGGGIATFYRNLAPPLRDQGVDIRVIEGSANHAGKRAQRTIDGVAVETLERVRLSRWWDRFGDYAATPGLRRHLAAAWAMWEQADFAAEADIVEATDWGFLFLPPAVEAIRPMIVQAHASVGQISVHDPLAGEETQDVLARLLERSVLSEWPTLQTYGAANSVFWGSETGSEVTVIRPAMPLSPPMDRPLGRHGLVIGRIQRWKGPQTLCEALVHLGGAAPEMSWVGRDTPWSGWESSSSGLLKSAFPDQWGKRVTPHTPVSPTEVARLQASALFNLVPSTWDVFNLTTVEAMASGRPTIVSTGAGAADLIVDGENGYQFAAGDGRALAAAIERVLAASPAEHARIGEAARDTVRRELDPATIARARIAAYQAAMLKFRDEPPAPVGGWLGELCRPGAPGAADFGAYLGQFPMRDIARHLGARLSGKLGRRFGLGGDRR